MREIRLVYFVYFTLYLFLADELTKHLLQHSCRPFRISRFFLGFEIDVRHSKPVRIASLPFYLRQYLSTSEGL